MVFHIVRIFFYVKEEARSQQVVLFPSLMFL